MIVRDTVQKLHDIIPSLVSVEDADFMRSSLKNYLAAGLLAIGVFSSGTAQAQTASDLNMALFLANVTVISVSTARLIGRPATTAFSRRYYAAYSDGAGGYNYSTQMVTLTEDEQNRLNAAMDPYASTLREAVDLQDEDGVAQYGRLVAIEVGVIVQARSSTASPMPSPSPTP